MCLGFPGKIISFGGEGTVLIDIGGVSRLAYLDLLDQEVDVGDYIICHAGFAISKLDQEEAAKRLELLQQLFDASHETY